MRLNRKVVWTVRALSAALLVALMLGVPKAISAQTPQEPSKPTAAQEGYVPVDTLPAAQQEKMPAAPLVALAYGFVWVVLLLYMWSIWARLGKVERELQAVSRRVAGGGRSA
jgi:CcmD family protein